MASAVLLWPMMLLIGYDCGQVAAAKQESKFREAMEMCVGKASIVGIRTAVMCGLLEAVGVT